MTVRIELKHVLYIDSYKELEKVFHIENMQRQLYNQSNRFNELDPYHFLNMYIRNTIHVNDKLTT